MDKITFEIVNILQEKPLKSNEIVLRLKDYFDSEDIINSLNNAVSNKKIKLNFLEGLYFC